MSDRTLRVDRGCDLRWCERRGGAPIPAVPYPPGDEQDDHGHLVVADWSEPVHGRTTYERWYSDSAADALRRDQVLA